MLARNTELKIAIGGVDVTAHFANHLTAFKYSDTFDGESDSCEMTLEDAQKILLRGNLPKRGADFNFTLVKYNWNSGGQTEILPLGAFELDEITYATPPTAMTLKFNSLPNKSASRGVVKNKAWEQVSLRKIAQDIAAESGLGLLYDAEDIEIKRAEQKEASLAFLQRLCKNNGLNLKVARKQLIIFTAEKYENGAAVITLTPELPVIKRCNFKAKSTAIYSGAKNSYSGNGITNWLFELLGGFGEMFTAVTQSAGENGGGTLNLNERVDSAAESERLSKSQLHEKNKKEWTLNLNLSGSFSFVAGNCFNVSGYGFYDGKYICERTEHSLGGGGYSTNVTAYRV